MSHENTKLRHERDALRAKLATCRSMMRDPSVADREIARAEARIEELLAQLDEAQERLTMWTDRRDTNFESYEADLVARIDAIDRKIGDNAKAKAMTRLEQLAAEMAELKKELAHVD